MSVLSCNKLIKHYNTGENIVKALDGVNIEIAGGEFVAIVGTSGSGKSTLLHLLGGLDNPTSGEITIRNVTIHNMDSEELTIFRRRNIGFVFQSYNLVPMLDVKSNITLPMELDGSEVDVNFLKEITDTLGLTELLERYPNTLSGGQQQRVAIARALVSKPAIILADEPTGNLDSHTSQEVVGLLRLTSRRFNQTTLMITHNEILSQLCDRVIRIEDGLIVKTV